MLAGPVRRVRRVARRSVRQPARCAGGGGEDGGQADQHLRRARRHLRPRRRPDHQAATEPDRERGPGPAQRQGHGAAPRRRPGHRARRHRAARPRHRGGAPALRLPRVPHAVRPPGRGVGHRPRRGVVRQRGPRGRGHPAGGTVRRGAAHRRAAPGHRAAGPGRGVGRARGSVADRGLGPGGRRRRRRGGVVARTDCSTIPPSASRWPTWWPIATSPPTASSRSCGRCSPAASTWPACRSTPGWPPTCSTRPKPATRSTTCSVGTPTSSCHTGDTAPEGQLDLGGDGTDAALHTAREALAVDRLVQPLLAALDAQGLRALNDDIEVPLVGVLARMEDVGVGVDIDELRALNDRLAAEATDLQQRIVRRRRRGVQRQLHASAAGHPVRQARAGPEQEDQDRLLHRCGVAREAGRSASDHRAPPALPRGGEAALDLRRRSLAEVDPSDGRIHATFNQTVARTGRLSSDAPNLHNIPVRSEEGRAFRRAFVPAPGSRAAGGRLQPDRAAVHRPPRRGPRSHRRLRGRRRHPHHHRRPGVRRRRRMRSPRLSGPRRRWCRYGLAYGMESYGLAQRLAISVPGGGGDPRRLLRGVPVGEGVHGAHGGRGPRAGVTPRRCSVAGGRSPSWRRATRASARPVSARP